jgi:DNA polymerase elongation subunit (family B)
LIRKFLKFWQHIDPDVVTGWYIEGFDIPYLHNRIAKLLGPDYVKKLSPWGEIRQREFNGDVRYQLMGISILDYQRLYKEFTYTSRENYRLNTITYAELGEKKDDYSEYESINDFYLKDPQKFIEYNIRDVELILKLDDKLALIDLALAVAYDSKINIDDCFTSVLLWDVIIHNYMLARGIVIPPVSSSLKTEKYRGAFVLDPVIGMHKWVCSFDVNSLYPSLIIKYNMSPETFMGVIEGFPSVPQLLEYGYPDSPEIELFAVAANGTCWDKSVKGMFPLLVEKMYADRQMWNSKKKAAKSKLEEAITAGNQADIAKYTVEVAISHIRQHSAKIILNSLYGAIGNPYFRWYMIEFAEAITLSGQFTIQYIGNGLDDYISRNVGKKSKYCIAQDTDSAYICLGELVSKYCDGKSTDEIIEFLAKVCSEKIEPFINKKFDEIRDMSNAYVQNLKMKREVIAERGVWRAKKNYALTVWYDENVRYTDEPKLKIVGLQGIRASTPEPCREAFKTALKLIMMKTQQDLTAQIEEFRLKFYEMPFEDIASSSGCSDLEKYQKSGNIPYQPGCPIHVRSALLYNKALKDKKLDKTFPLIKSGDHLKYCYMKLPNPIKENVFGIVTALPRQLNLAEYIDYAKQFETTFLKPVKSICDAIGWDTEETTSLDDFFF